MSQEYWKQAWATLNGKDAGDIKETEHDAGQDSQPSGYVLKIDPQDLEDPGAPTNGVLTHAPMGDYDVVELAIFDQPAARIRWVADQAEGAGMVGAAKALPGAQGLEDDAVAALRFSAAEEAWNVGADEVYTVVGAQQKEDLEAAGWSVVAAVTTA